MFLYLLLQVRLTVDDPSGTLGNMDCKTVPSPEMCPNTWLYLDENNDWKIDAELRIECGKF